MSLSSGSLSIFICLYGAFWFSPFTIGQRFKEIGIRKVIGEGIFSIISLLSKDFLKLVFISICIAFPVAWLVIDNWLQNLACHMNITWWTFVVAGICVLLIAFATLCFQATRAALSNLVKSLQKD